MEGKEQLAVIIPMLKEVAALIGDDQLEDPTPCVDFNVAGVLGHMSGLATAFAPMFRGETASAAPPPADGFDAVMDSLLAAVQSEGALERTIDSPMGAMPGSVFARLVAFDGLVHGWDLASSTGQSWEPPDALVDEVDAFARQAITPEMRDGNAFAPEQQPPAGASPMLRLIAFTGRST